MSSPQSSGYIGVAPGVVGVASQVLFTPSGTGALVRDVEEKLREMVSVTDFLGVDPTGVANSTAGIQAAIDALYAAGGGTLFFPVGTYMITTLQGKYGVSLMGASPQPFLEVSTQAKGSVLLQQSGTNAPMYLSDQTNGPSRTTGTIGTPTEKRDQAMSISNLAWRGNRAGQTTVASDILRLYQTWNVKIHNCAFVDCKGFGIRALDCNVLDIHDNSFINAPLFLEALGDSKVCRNQIGGTKDVYPCVWISASGELSWQTLYNDNIIFNNANSAAISFPTATFDAGTEEATTSVAHGWPDETPVVVTTTGTLPGGLSATETYYVKSTGANTLKLATTRKNLTAGTYVNISSAGSGTHTIQLGESACIYLNGGSGTVKLNTFTGNRVDQAYGCGILINGADTNTFCGNIIVAAGTGNATGQAGIELKGAASQNIFVGNLIDGQTIGTSNQVYGILGTASDTNNQITGNNIKNHATADISVAAGYRITDESDVRWVGFNEMYLVNGTPAVALIGGSRHPAWHLDSASLEYVGCSVVMPVGWEDVAATFYWVNAGGGSGNVVLAWTGEGRAAGGTSGADEFTVIHTVTAGAQDVIMETLLSTTATTQVTQGDILNLRFGRAGADGADTLGNDIALLGVKLTRV